MFKLKKSGRLEVLKVCGFILPHVLHKASNLNFTVRFSLWSCATACVCGGPPSFVYVQTFLCVIFGRFLRLSAFVRHPNSAACNLVEPNFHSTKCTCVRPVSSQPNEIMHMVITTLWLHCHLPRHTSSSTKNTSEAFNWNFYSVFFISRGMCPHLHLLLRFSWVSQQDWWWCQSVHASDDFMIVLEIYFVYSTTILHIRYFYSLILQGRFNVSIYFEQRRNRRVWENNSMEKNQPDESHGDQHTHQFYVVGGH